MDATVAALLEQVKGQIEDSLRGSVFIDPETGEGSWTRRAVEKALADTIPDTGVGGYEVGKPYQPTYVQWVEHHKTKLAMARYRLVYAAAYDSGDWDIVLEYYEHAQISFLLAVKGMRKHGPAELVPDVILTTIKIQPPMSAEFIEMSFVPDKD